MKSKIISIVVNFVIYSLGLGLCTFLYNQYNVTNMIPLFSLMYLMGIISMGTMFIIDGKFSR